MRQKLNIIVVLATHTLCVATLSQSEQAGGVRARQKSFSLHSLHYCPCPFLHTVLRLALCFCIFLMSSQCFAIRMHILRLFWNRARRFCLSKQRRNFCTYYFAHTAYQKRPFTPSPNFITNFKIWKNCRLSLFKKILSYS